MSLNDKLLKAAAVDSGITPSEHFGVMTYTGNDESGHSINGGKFGGAASFNGSNSKIDLDNLNLGGAAERTISAWVYVKSLSSVITIYQHGAASNGQRFGFAIDTAGKVYVEYYNRDSITTASHISVNTWYHLAAVYNGGVIETATNTQIYVNGSAVSMSSTGSQTGVANTSNSNYGIGYRRDSTSQYFNGKIDQLRIFSKALSSSEITSLYDETAATVESLSPLGNETVDTLQVLGDTSCLALYKFENNEDDVSGNYNGTGTEIQYAAGRYGQAAQFNGSSKVDITGFANFLSTGVSISAWVNVDSFSNGPTVVNLYSNNSIVFGTNSSGNFFRSGQGTTVTSNTAMTTGTWNHIVMAADTSGDVNLYLNGNAVGSGSCGTGMYNDNNNNDLIGAYGTLDQPMNGRIDQVRIFNKQISASEVTTLYEENALVASYRFEGNSNDDRRTFDGTDSNVTYEFGLNFTPDLIWLKPINQTENHNVYDSSRGAFKQIVPNLTSAESTQGNTVASFDVGGFTTNGDNNTNKSGINYVAWCFKAGGGTTTTNNDGELTVNVQANQDAGFSIITFDGITDPNEDRSFGHGLSQEPEYIWMKRRNASQHNAVFAKIDGTWEYFDGTSSTDGGGDYSAYIATTSTVIDIHDAAEWFADPSSEYVYWCWHSVENYSKIGTYEGNGSTDGPIVETGFEVGYLMVKRVDSADNWIILDSKRSTTNPRKNALFPNLTQSELSSGYDVDFLSNGFQIKTSDNAMNNSSGTYLFMSFAVDPDTETPTLAKSFDVSTYTGNASNNSVDIGFDAGLTWIKNRTDTGSYHILFDKVRGLNQVLHSNLTNAEQGSSNNFEYNNGTLSFDGSTTWGNKSGSNYVLWAWAADDNEPTLFGGPAKAVYKFEDNVNDVTGNYNGTATSITYNSSGKFNKSADFSSSNSQITTNLAQSDTAAFTWSAWIKVHDFQGISNVNVLGTMNPSSPYNGVAIFLDVTAISLGEGGSNIGNILSSPSINTWYHIVVAYDGSQFKCYADGSLVLTVTNSNTDGGNFWMGKGGPTTWTTFDGELDQVRIYNGAVSDIGVAALYAETTSDNDDLTLAAPKETIISANANSGFSIVKWEGDGSSNRKIPHGLSAKCDLVIIKDMDSADKWVVQLPQLGDNARMVLEGTAAKTDDSTTAQAGNATVFGIGGDNAVNKSGDNFIAYCFHSVSGYSKIGTYTGNGSTQSITGLGFQPDWILIKQTNASNSWRIFDSVRGLDSPQTLFANLDFAEDSESNTVSSFDSDGFTMGSQQGVNDNGDTYLYMAFKIN